MKYKILAVAILAFIAVESSAFKVTILKEKHGGDGSGNYNYVNRSVEDETVDIQGVPVTQSRTINIFCEGTGGNACPNNIAYNGGGSGEQPPITALLP